MSAGNNLKECFIELTDSCNLSCTYCDKHYGNKFIDLCLFEKIFKQITTLYFKKINYICLWGGEPLLHPEIDKIFLIIEKYFKIIPCNFTLAINTNGILLEKHIGKIKKLCSLNDINIVLYVSLDGYGIQGNSNRKLNLKEYNTIVNNIDYILGEIKEKNFSIYISSVLSFKKESLFNINKFIKFWNNKNVKVNFCFQELFSGVNMKITNDLLRNLLKRFLFIYKRKNNIIIESNKNINNIIRIDSYGKSYNFVDKSFPNSTDFIIGNNGNLDFLKNIDWYKKIDNNLLWSMIYIDKNYISLINKFYNKINKCL